MDMMIMFRLILCTCFLYLSVGEIIHGRILLDGDPYRYNRLPIDSILTVQLQDGSLADAPTTVLRVAEFLHLVAFPIFYEIEIPADVSPALSYSLLARITKDDELLYTNEEYISVQIQPDSSAKIDIPVIDVNLNDIDRRWLENLRKTSWPEMLGQQGEYAVEYIKKKTGLTNVFIIREGSESSVLRDYQKDRVVILVEKNGVVIDVPRSG